MKNQSKVGPFSPATNSVKAADVTNPASIDLNKPATIDLNKPVSASAAPAKDIASKTMTPATAGSLGVIREGRKVDVNQKSSKSVSSLHNDSVDLKSKTFQHDRSMMQNTSYGSLSNLNRSLRESSKRDGSVMREKKQNVVKSQQNMAQLKNRIEALKRNVE